MRRESHKILIYQLPRICITREQLP